MENFVDKTVLLLYINITAKEFKMGKFDLNYGGFKKSNIFFILLLCIFIYNCNPKKDKTFNSDDLNNSTSDSQHNTINEKIESITGKKLATLKEVVDATDMEIYGEELFVLDEVLVYV